jgi:hypothetical protein
MTSGNSLCVAGFGARHYLVTLRYTQTGLEESKLAMKSSGI